MVRKLLLQNNIHYNIVLFVQNDVCWVEADSFKSWRGWLIIWRWKWLGSNTKLPGGLDFHWSRMKRRDLGDEWTWCCPYNSLIWFWVLKGTFIHLHEDSLGQWPPWRSIFVKDNLGLKWPPWRLGNHVKGWSESVLDSGELRTIRNLRI